MILWKKKRFQGYFKKKVSKRSARKTSEHIKTETEFIWKMCDYKCRFLPVSQIEGGTGGGGVDDGVKNAEIVQYCNEMGHIHWDSGGAALGKDKRT